MNARAPSSRCPAAFRTSEKSHASASRAAFPSTALTTVRRLTPASAATASSVVSAQPRATNSRAAASSLDAAVEPLAAAAYRRGWRPPRAEGPSRDELARVLGGTAVPG